MGFGCPICSEKLDRLPAEAQGRSGGAGRGELNISATPCGHIFHAYCIQKWLTGNLASSKQCPCCRKDVPRLRCLSLYPTTYDESMLDESLSQGSDGPNPCNHGEMISSLKNQIDRLQSDLKEKNQLYDLLSSDHETLMEKFGKEKTTCDTWMMRAKQYESYKDLANELEVRAQRAESQLKTYSQLNSMIKGVEVNVNEDLANASLTMDTVRSLLEIKHVLSSELKKKDKSCSELKENYEKMRQDKLKLKGMYDKKVSELKELRHIYEISKVNGRVRSTSPAPGTSQVVDCTTPKAFRTKRRFQESLSKSKLEQTQTATSPDMDVDVDVFPMSFKPKKMKSTKASSQPVSRAEKKDFTTHAKKVSKFECAISPITGTPTKNLDSTITLDDSDNDNDDFQEELRIRGNVPGAPLPISATRMKNLKNKSQKPVLGMGSESRPKKFTFKKPTP